MEIIKEFIPFVKVAIIAAIALPVGALIFFIIAWFKAIKTFNK